jgi:hypothetical protein
VKAFYRATKSLVALDRLVEALQMAHMGLRIDTKNEAMRTEWESIKAKLLKKEKEEDLKRAKEQEKLEKENALAKAIEVSLILRTIVIMA